MKIRRPMERWFEVPNDPDKARIKIKHIIPGDLRKIRDETQTFDVTYENDKPIIKQTSDNRADREKLLQMRVVDWENIFDENDAPMKCTPENIIRASNEIEGFDELVIELSNKLSNDIVSEAKAQEKNLLTTSTDY